MNALRKRLTRWALLLGVALGVPTILFPAFVAQVGTYVLFSVWLAVTIIFVRLAWLSFHDPKASARSAHFITGIAITGLSLTVGLVWTIASYITGLPWMLNSPVVGAYIIGVTLGGVLYLTTPDTEGEVPIDHRRLLWTALIIGLAIGLAVWGFGLERGLAPAPI